MPKPSCWRSGSRAICASSALPVRICPSFSISSTTRKSMKTKPSWSSAPAMRRSRTRSGSMARGLYIAGAVGGYPLIKQAMNQGYEVIESILGNPVEPADEPLLRSKFANWAHATSVAQALAITQRNVPLLAGITTLQLREFLLDSDVRTPAPQQILFRRNDYTNTFFTIVEGEVFVEIGGESEESRWIRLGAGSFFGELGLISGRRRAATVKAGDGCVLIETPRRSILKLIASVDSVRKGVDAVFLRNAVRAYLSQDL